MIVERVCFLGILLNGIIGKNGIVMEICDGTFKRDGTVGGLVFSIDLYCVGLSVGSEVGLSSMEKVISMVWQLEMIHLL